MATEKKRALVVLGILGAFVVSCCTGGWFFLVRPMSRFAEANAAFGRALHDEFDGAVWTFVPRPSDDNWVLVIGLPEAPDAEAVRAMAETTWRLHAEHRAGGSIVIGGIAIGRANANVVDDESRHGTSTGWQRNLVSATDLIESTGVAAPPSDAILSMVSGAVED